MTSIDNLVRARIRAIRQHLGWSLDDLAAKSGVGASTISRIETGNRSISFDVLVPIARELDVSVDELIATELDEDVVICPEPQHGTGMTRWMLSRPGSRVQAIKMRLQPEAPEPELRIHPGHDFMFVLEGAVCLMLGEARHRIAAGESAEFSTMTPHAVRAVDGCAEVIMILERDGAMAHFDD